MVDKSKQKESRILLLPGIYDETLALLARTHHYFHQWGLAQNHVFLNERERSMFASEMSRITIRLSCVMSWLMARKAVLEGENALPEGIESYRLECRDVCLNQHIEAETMLPPDMAELLDQTFELYQRVARLDEAAPRP
jgi:hypothetical protein